MRICLSSALGALALLISAASVSAAESVAEIQSLLRQGKPAEALAQADSLTNKNANDSQARFLKGVALTEMGRANEAIAVFLKLTQDFPSLPEPYNNLAVLYARQNQYDKARSTLEAAIRTHPSYAIAHQNLGDLYAQLANQAYGKALQIDNGRGEPPQSQLALITEIAPAPRPLVVASSTIQPPVPPAMPAIKPIEKALPAEKPSPIEKPPPIAAIPPPPPPPVQPTPIPEPAQPATPPKPPAPPPSMTAETTSADTAVLQAAKDWAKAWSAKDAKAYLSYYDRDFDVPDKRSRQDWEREREQRLGKGGPISVELENPRVTIDGDRATVRFRQHYRSSGFSGSTAKTLEFVRRGERWRIYRELIGN